MPLSYGHVYPLGIKLPKSVSMLKLVFIFFPAPIPKVREPHHHFKPQKVSSHLPQNYHKPQQNPTQKSSRPWFLDMQHHVTIKCLPLVQVTDERLPEM